MNAVFLDRDGTINVGVPVFERVDSTNKLVLLPTVMDALKKLATLDFGIFIITNQAGIAEGLLSDTDFDTIQKELLKMITPSGITIIKTYYCPHGQGSSCNCRKPKPGLLLQAAKEFAIDLKSSWMIGDRATDVEAGINAGTRTIFVESGASKTAYDRATYSVATLSDAVTILSREE